MLDWLIEVLNNGSLATWGPFILLVFCGVGLPMPEDIILVTAGFLSEKNGTSFLATSFLMYVGILVGDGLVYFVGRRFGRQALSTRFGRWLAPPERLARVETLFERYGSWVILVARFLPGLRAPTYLTAGVIRYSAVRFFALDGLAAIISAPVFVWFGHWAFRKYSENMDLIEETLGRTQIAFIAGALGIIAVLFFFARATRRREQSPPSSSQEL